MGQGKGLTDQQGVAFFDTPERLVQAVIAVVSRLVVGKPQETPGLRLAVVFAESDYRPPLPVWDHSVIDSSNRTAALVEVVDGVRLSGHHLVPAHRSLRAQVALPRRAALALAG